MGRKIPGKKHRTIKDPAKQREASLERIKNKINNPPRNSDLQEIPKSLLRLISLKKSAQDKTIFKASRKSSRRKKRRNEPMCVAKVLDKYPNMKSTGYIPNLVQKPDESPESFLKRMNIMTQNMIEEAEFEKKFSVQIKRNEETGEILNIKKIKTKKSKKKTLSEKRKEKILKKKENANGFKDFNQLKDNIKFGEVVERPPVLLSNIKNNNKVKKVGKKNYSNLLLNNLVEEKEVKKQFKSSIEKERAENERKFIVEAYRKTKKSNKQCL